MDIRYSNNLPLLLRKEEAESRPKMEFIPKTLQDITIEQLCEATDGLNGGRFAKPSTDFDRARNSKNSLYSSQQNLSQTRPGSTTSSSNFSRSKFYGSQQNLQTSNKMSVSSSSSYGSMVVDQNKNPVNSYDANAIDPWLNAWDSPPANSSQPPPSAAPRNNYTATSNAQFRVPAPKNGNALGGYNSLVNSNGNGRQFSNQLSSSNALHRTQSQNSYSNNNNSDPWSGDSPNPFLLSPPLYVSSRAVHFIYHVPTLIPLMLWFTRFMSTVEGNGHVALISDKECCSRRVCSTGAFF